MAIKIIKEGKKEFEYTCPYCGCVFIYELEDIEPGDIVECPYCHEQLHINKLKDITNYPYPNMIPCDKKVYDPMTVPDILNPDKPNITWATQQSGKSCKDCHVYQKMMRGEYTVDDSCFWCPNNPCKVTCNSINCTNSETNGTAQAMREGKIKIYNSSNHIKGDRVDG